MFLFLFLRVPIKGTIWCLARAADGRVFYFDTQSKKSIWTLPPELEGVAMPLFPSDVKKQQQEEDEQTADKSKPKSSLTGS